MLCTVGLLRLRGWHEYKTIPNYFNHAGCTRWCGVRHAWRLAQVWLLVKRGSADRLCDFLMIDLCTDCQSNPNGGGRGDFKRMCCRVRFLRTLPSNEMRMDWLKRWRAQGHEAQATLTEYKRQLKGDNE